ncbi:MAG: iron uptake porin [Gloeomargaritaceae cyanobacterium C42_A2020_066]|nr:iron uptake porin [Gloeomargaritaceae cyanobacterium C42_A2020_066]
MKTFLLKSLQFGSASLGLALLTGGTAFAGEPAATVSGLSSSAASLEQVQKYSGAEFDYAQVTSVSEFSDVKPTDWAFLALQSLVERYGCIAGYPTTPPTYKGQRAMTRYEFAAGLNACLDRINELIAAAVEDKVTKEDLMKVQKLQEEFAAELATLRGRVDSLEARTATLEAQQFSTTTKLAGQAIFGVQGAFGGDVALPRAPLGRFLNESTPGTNVQDNTTFGYRVNLNFNTSFTGKDLLVTTLQATDLPFGNFANSNSAIAATGTNNAALGYSFLNNTNGGNVGIYWLTYSFPVLNDKGKVAVTAYGGGINDYVDTLSPFNDDGQGALSAFGLRNPIYNQNLAVGVGPTFTYSFGKDDMFNIAVGYLAQGSGGTGAFAPTDGFTGSSYTAWTQFTAYPMENLGLSLLYAHGYSEPTNALDFGGGVGTNFASACFLAGITCQADSVSLQFKWQAMKNFILSGWVGGIFQSETGNTPNFGTTSLTYALAFAFPDVGTPGSQAGIIVGAAPYVTDRSGAATAQGADDVPLLVELHYRWKVNEYISVTPGIYGVFNPNGNEGNDAVYVGAIRTTFSF